MNKIKIDKNGHFAGNLDLRGYGFALPSGLADRDTRKEPR